MCALSAHPSEQNHDDYLFARADQGDLANGILDYSSDEDMGLKIKVYKHGKCQTESHVSCDIRFDEI